MNNKLGSEPAFPLGLQEITNPDWTERPANSGMSKRFYAACAALNGIISAMECRKSATVEEDVALAYKYADEFLKQENE